MPIGWNLLGRGELREKQAPEEEGRHDSRRKLLE
jgi:hypothetical protein